MYIHIIYLYILYLTKINITSLFSLKIIFKILQLILTLQGNCQNIYESTEQVTILENNQCYNCTDLGSQIDVPYNSSIICQEETSTKIFNISGQLHFYLINPDYSNVYFSQGQISLKILLNDTSPYILISQNSSCESIIEENVSTTIQFSNKLESSQVMKFNEIQIYTMYVVQNAILMVDKLFAENLITQNAAQLNISVNKTYFMASESNLIKSNNSEQLAQIEILSISDTSQVYCSNLNANQAIYVNSSLTSYNITTNTLFVTSKGKVSSIYANIKNLTGLDECQMDFQYANIKILNFSSEIAVPTIRIQGQELVINESIHAVLISKIIYPKIYFLNTIGDINSDIISQEMIIQNSTIVYGNNDSYLEGQIRGLLNLMIQNSTFYNYYNHNQTIEEKIVLINSSFYQIGTLITQMLSANYSLINISQSLDIKVIGSYFSTIYIEEQSSICNGQILSSNFTTGSLKVQKFSGIESVLCISNLVLKQIIYDQYQESLLDIVAKQVVNDYLYQETVNQFCKITGSLCIEQGASLQSNTIQATSIIANGSMVTGALLKKLKIYVSRLLYVVQEVYVKQIDLYFGTVDASEYIVQTGYLRLNKSLMIQDFYINGTNIFINPRTYVTQIQQLYTLTVMGVFQQSNDSTTQGEFGLFNEKTTIENITNTQGYICINNSFIFTEKDSSIFARKLVFTGTTATILGYLSLQSNDRLHSTIEIKATNITLGKTLVHGQYSTQRQKNCCGGSNLIFGGCSQGQPEPLIDLSQQIEYQIPPSGDVCSINNLTVTGGVSGGGIYIQANLVNLTDSIIANGEQGVCNENYCGGSGPGGNIQINTEILMFNQSVLVSANGAGCSNNSLSGGAGSAGQILITAVQYIMYNSKDSYQSTQEQLQISQKDGQCHFAAVTAVDYCQSLFSVLDTSSMTCIIPWWVVLLIVLISTVLVSLIILAIVCIVTTFRDKRLDKELDITKMSQMNQFVVQLEDLLETTDLSE